MFRASKIFRALTITTDVEAVSPGMEAKEARFVPASPGNRTECPNLRPRRPLGGFHDDWSAAWEPSKPYGSSSFHSQPNPSREAPHPTSRLALCHWKSGVSNRCRAPLFFFVQIGPGPGFEPVTFYLGKVRYRTYKLITQQEKIQPVPQLLHTWFRSKAQSSRLSIVDCRLSCSSTNLL